MSLFTWKRQTLLSALVTVAVVVTICMSGCGDKGTNIGIAPTYTVTVLSVSTSASGSGSYAAGAIVTIKAGTPPSGQQFKNWMSSSNGVTFVNANNATTTFTMPANAVTVTAVFEQSSNVGSIVGTWVNSADPTETYVFRADGSCSWTYEGDVITFSYTVISGKIELSAGSDYIALIYNGGDTFVDKYGDTFRKDSGNTTTPNNYIVTVDISPPGSGTVSRNPNASSYAPGTVIRFTAVPANGYIFKHWVGADIYTDNPLTITLGNFDGFITAVFEQAGVNATWNSDTVLLGNVQGYPFAGVYEFNNLTIGDNVTVTSGGISQLVIKVSGTLKIGTNSKIVVRNGYYSYAPLVTPASLTLANVMSKAVYRGNGYSLFANIYGKGGNGGNGGRGGDGYGFSTGNSTRICFPGGRGGGGGGGGFGGGIGGKGGDGGIAPPTILGVCVESAGFEGTAGLANGGNGGAGGGGASIGGGAIGVGTSGSAGSGGGGNGGNGGRGNYTEPTNSNNGIVGPGGGGGGGGGGYGGGILTITADVILYSATSRFIVSGQQGGSGGGGGEGGGSIVNGVRTNGNGGNGTNGQNGVGGLLIINSRTSIPESMYNLTSAVVIGTASNSKGGHGTVIGGPSGGFLNIDQ